MSAEKGRGTIVKWGGVVVAGVNTKSLAVNNERIDITDDDSGPWPEALAEPGNKSVTISCSGVTKDSVLLDASLNPTNIIGAMEFVRANGATVSGDFTIDSYTETGERAGAKTFEASFSSEGAITLEDSGS